MQGNYDMAPGQAKVGGTHAADASSMLRGCSGFCFEHVTLVTSWAHLLPLNSNLLYVVFKLDQVCQNRQLEVLGMITFLLAAIVTATDNANADAKEAAAALAC